MSDTLSGFFDLIVERAAERAATIVLEQLEAREPESPWLDANGAAAYLSLPVKRLRNLCASNAIPFVRQGRRILFHRQELDLWLEAQAEGWRPPVRLRTERRRR